MIERNGQAHICINQLYGLYDAKVYFLGSLQQAISHTIGSDEANKAKWARFTLND